MAVSACTLRRNFQCVVSRANEARDLFSKKGGALSPKCRNMNEFLF